MTFLCGAEKDALKSEKTEDPKSVARQWQEYQTGFLADHLSQSINNFAQALHLNAPGYYYSIASTASDWVAADFAGLTQGQIREESS